MDSHPPSNVSPTHNLGGSGPLPFIEWTVQASFNQHEIERSFSVLFFLGKPSDDPSNWETSSNYVGGVHAFKTSLDTQAGGSDSLIQGFVHLNSHILERSKLTSLEAAAVKPYLTENLHWEVVKNNGRPGTDELTSLRVTVWSHRLSVPSDGMFPVPSDRKSYPEITEGRSH